MSIKYVTCITKQDKRSPKANTALHSNLFLFQIKLHQCWAPTKAQFIFAWINFVNSIAWNYKIEFMFILKHFKKSWKLWKLLAEENGSKFDWKWDFWDLKTLRMKILETWNYLKTRIGKIIYKMGFGKNYF